MHTDRERAEKHANVLGCGPVFVCMYSVCRTEMRTAVAGQQKAKTRSARDLRRRGFA